MTFILNLAPNGMVPTKSMTPHVPYTPVEVLADVCASMEVGGITYLHLHARDNRGVPSGEKALNATFIEAIRTNYEDLPICISCSGRINPDFESRAEVLSLKGDLKPDMASLTLSSLNFSHSASVNPPEIIIKLAVKMQENGIKPELEIFDVGMMNYAQYMIAKGYLKPPFYFNILLGNIFSAQTKAAHLGAILADMPSESHWSIGGIGKAQLPAHLLSFSQGGGIRTGIEDSIWMDVDKTTLATNAMLVKRVHDLAQLTNQKMMTPDDFKKWLS